MKSVEIKKNLRDKKIVDLTKELGSESEKLAKTRMEVAAKKLKNFSLVKQQRKQIARIYTIINEKFEESDGK
jgi:ribosomal protein L29